MPTSVPGSSPRTAARGFTLIELLVVMAIVALASALIVVALPDRTQDRLNEEAERLAAFLESARSESRASGVAVTWVPTSGQDSNSGDFRLVGLPASMVVSGRWLSKGVSAEIVGANAITLGPEPILPAQRLVLHLEDRRVVLASDGLAPFVIVESGRP